MRFRTKHLYILVECDGLVWETNWYVVKKATAADEKKGRAFTCKP
jgi:hypothetical protein